MYPKMYKLNKPVVVENAEYKILFPNFVSCNQDVSSS